MVGGGLAASVGVGEDFDSRLDCLDKGSEGAPGSTAGVPTALHGAWHLLMTDEPDGGDSRTDDSGDRGIHSQRARLIRFSTPSLGNHAVM